MLTIAGYAGFVLFFGFVGFFLILTSFQVSAGWGEIALSLAACAAVPVVCWFAAHELRGVRYPIWHREMLLAKFALLTVLVPVGLSAFWLYEYVAFGSFQANFVPAVGALIFAAVWFRIGKLRLTMARETAQAFGVANIDFEGRHASDIPDNVATSPQG